MQLSLELDDDKGGEDAAPTEVAPGLLLLRRYARPQDDALLAGVRGVTASAPFVRMRTPGGRLMSAALTNCGEVGWWSDTSGYRYTPVDPRTGAPWPEMPSAFRALAPQAAARAGFPGFEPDACLVNRYEPGAKMSLHQDRDERDFTAPIVSVSLGLPAVFSWGGPVRGGPTHKIRLEHGDVVVWGGEVRLHFHGVDPVREGHHPKTGRCRINLTFRKAR